MNLSESNFKVLNILLNCDNKHCIGKDCPLFREEDAFCRYESALYAITTGIKLRFDERNNGLSEYPPSTLAKFAETSSAEIIEEAIEEVIAEKESVSEPSQKPKRGRKKKDMTLKPRKPKVTENVEENTIENS